MKLNRLRPRRPSPALVIACVALFVSLGGVSYGVATGFIDSREIRNNTIRTQDLRNNDIRAVDIRNSTIRGRDVALNALTGGDIAESRLEKVPAAVSSDNAAALGGIGPDGFVRADSSPFTALAAGASWETISGETPPGFYKDAFGFVHLHGVVRKGAGVGDVAVVLPAEARPGAIKRFAAYSENDTGTPAVVGVLLEADGELRTAGTAPGTDTLLSLEGITFRAGD